MKQKLAQQFPTKSPRIIKQNPEKVNDRKKIAKSNDNTSKNNLLKSMQSKTMVSSPSKGSVMKPMGTKTPLKHQTISKVKPSQSKTASKAKQSTVNVSPSKKKLPMSLIYGVFGKPSDKKKKKQSASKVNTYSRNINKSVYSF